jgi:hypothetical protein
MENNDSSAKISLRDTSSDMNYIVNGNKRLRRNRPTSTNTFDSSTEAIMKLCSCEQFLSVPLTLVFRYNKTQSMPLLTRVEADLLLQIGSLARELDVLLGMCRDVWGWSVSRREIVSFCSSTLTYRSLVPLISLGSNSEESKVEEDDCRRTRTDQDILLYVEVEWQRVILDLLQCTSSLQQCSEHNWTWSDSLLDAVSNQSNNGNEDSRNKPNISSSAKALAHEKQLLSEVEEELIRRIQHIAVNGEEWTTYKAESKPSIHDLCFSTFCFRMFDMSNEIVDDATSTSSDLSQTTIDRNNGYERTKGVSRSRLTKEAIEIDFVTDKIEESANETIPEETAEAYPDSMANTQNAIVALRNMNSKRSWNDV